MKIHLYPVFFRSQDCGRLFMTQRLGALERSEAEINLARLVLQGLLPPNSFLGGCECEVDYSTMAGYWIVPE